GTEDPAVDNSAGGRKFLQYCRGIPLGCLVEDPGKELGTVAWRGASPLGEQKGTPLAPREMLLEQREDHKLLVVEMVAQRTHERVGRDRDVGAARQGVIDCADGRLKLPMFVEHAVDFAELVGVV